MRLTQEWRKERFESFGEALLKDIERDQGIALEDAPNASLEDDELTCLGIKPSYLQLPNEKLMFPVFGESFYGTLPRPKALMGDCPFQVKRAEAQDLIEKLWFGHKSCRFHSNSESKDIFELIVWMGNVREDEEDVSFDIRIICEILSQDMNTLKVSMSDGLNSCLGNEQGVILGSRILHQYLRQYGWKTMPWHLMACHCLIQRQWCQSKKYRKELLDAHIMAADVFLMYPQDTDGETMMGFLIRVGEALEALGLFEEAAEVYLETARSAFIIKDKEEWTLLVNAGIAHKRALDFESSLQCYVWALGVLARTRGDNWNLNDADTLHVVRNLSALYAHLQQNAASNADIFAAFSFFALLDAAGFRPPLDDTNFPFSYFVQHAKVVIKPMYARPKIAKKTIVEAFRAGTVDGHKEQLLKAANCNLQVIPNGPALTSSQQRKKNIKTANRFIKDHGVTNQVPCYYCGSIANGNKELLKCPCAEVFYCNDQCQKEHWHVHKKVCGMRVDKCDNCGARQIGNQKLLDCPCKTVSYCCELCQEEDWMQHRESCTQLRNDKERATPTKKGKKKKKTKKKNK